MQCNLSVLCADQPYSHATVFFFVAPVIQDEPEKITTENLEFLVVEGTAGLCFASLGIPWPD